VGRAPGGPFIDCHGLALSSQNVHDPPCRAFVRCHWFAEFPRGKRGVRSCCLSSSTDWATFVDEHCCGKNWVSKPTLQLCAAATLCRRPELYLMPTAHGWWGSGRLPAAVDLVSVFKLIHSMRLRSRRSASSNDVAEFSSPTGNRSDGRLPRYSVKPGIVGRVLKDGLSSENRQLAHPYIGVTAVTTHGGSTAKLRPRARSFSALDDARDGNGIGPGGVRHSAGITT
jgi:hypothetical protein